MDFGIFSLASRRDAADAPAALIADAAEQTRLADSLGFSTAWFAEHHFSNYGSIPSPLTMAAYCAPQTRRIRLATGVVVLPLYAPARLLAEIGLVDAMSGGRLVVGVGSGYQPFEFERFGADLGEATARSLEMLDILELGLTRERFEYRGAHYELPPTQINVRPARRPEIWLAGSAPELLRRAAERGYPVMASGRTSGAGALAEARAAYATLRARTGRDPDRMDFACLTVAHVCDTRREALEFAENLRYQVRLGAGLRKREEILADDGLLREAPFPGEPSPEDIADAMMIGGPERCAERCVDLLRRARPCHVALYFRVGRVRQARALRSMERFAGEVVPLVEQALGPLSAFAPRAEAA